MLLAIWLPVAVFLAVHAVRLGLLWWFGEQSAVERALSLQKREVDREKISASTRAFLSARSSFFRHSLELPHGFAPRWLLRRSMRRLSPTQDFTKWALAGRRLVKIEKELEAAAFFRAAALRQPAVAYTVAYLHYAAAALLILCLWGTPLIHVPAGWFSPVGFLFSISSGQATYLGILPWAIICSATIEAGLFSLAALTGLLAPPAKKSFTESLLGG